MIAQELTSKPAADGATPAPAAAAAAAADTPGTAQGMFKNARIMHTIQRVHTRRTHNTQAHKTQLLYNLIAPEHYLCSYEITTTKTN